MYSNLVCKELVGLRPKKGSLCFGRRVEPNRTRLEWVHRWQVNPEGVGLLCRYQRMTWISA